MTTATITVIERAKVEQINQAHRAVESAYGETLVHARDCGNMLAAVKADLTHGEWGPWLEQHFEGSARTAQVYMQIAGAPELTTNTQPSADLSIAGALKQVQKPRQPSGSEVTNLMRGMSSAGERPSTAERLDDARDRLRSEASVVWSERQTSKRHRIIDQLEETRSKLDTAAAGGLSKFGIAEALREAAVEARRTVTALEDLAFSFER